MYTEYYYKLLDAYKVLKALREMDAFKDVPAKNFDFALFFIGNAAGALQGKAWDECTQKDGAPVMAESERREDALRLANALDNLTDAGKMNLAYRIGCSPAQLAHDIESLYDFVSEHANDEREQIDE